MLEIVSIMFPGIIFAYAAEYLMHKKVSRHYFIFLCIFNIFALNVASLLLRDYLAFFLTADGYSQAVGSKDTAAVLLKHLVFACVAGVPLSFVEAYIGKAFSVHLEKKEGEEHHEKDEEA